ncbi:hypothetical protein AMTR_s00109p00109760 [Amborella trichopoda]|uniref:AMP-binding enzyme C-terminal domain-containing protein n=1 Tax=Amborella trichopoda TaxID=13333 RepID=W1NTX1_AMBTC|nr:hypothetical protein AMTR_s00109p00109760 [Amborella trichopoda]
MEVVKAIAKQASAEHDRAALRFDMKTHSYGQLISATWQMLQELEAATTKSFQSEGVVGGKWSLGGARVGILAKPSAEFVAGVLATWFGSGVHPDVAECSVLGLSDEDYGQVVCAVIVPEASARERAKQESRPAMTLEVLQAWAKDKLAPYKIPTKLFVLDAFKRNHMGKVNKKDLKKELEQLEQ